MYKELIFSIYQDLVLMNELRWGPKPHLSYLAKESSQTVR